MATYRQNVNPTSGDTAYNAGDIWINTISYSRYVFTTGNTWSWTAEGSGVLYANVDISKRIN